MVLRLGTQSRCFGHVKDAGRGCRHPTARDSAAGRLVAFNTSRCDEGADFIYRPAELVRDARGRVTPRSFWFPYSKAYAEGFGDMQRRRSPIRGAERAVGFPVLVPRWQRSSRMSSRLARQVGTAK